jgi:hypothetical protein
MHPNSRPASLLTLSLLSMTASTAPSFFSTRQRRLRLIWASGDVDGLLAADVGSLANNLGPGPSLLATNLGQKSRFLWV